MSIVLGDLLGDTIMETCRHPLVSVTLNTYSHFLPALQRDAAARMNTVFERWRLASLSIPSWNQIAGFLESMRQLRDDRRSGADTLMTAATHGIVDADLVALAHFVASR